MQTVVQNLLKITTTNNVLLNSSLNYYIFKTKLTVIHNTIFLFDVFDNIEIKTKFKKKRKYNYILFFIIIKLIFVFSILILVNKSIKI